MIKKLFLSLAFLSMATFSHAETIQLFMLGDLAISTTTEVWFSIQGTSGSDTPATDRMGVAASNGKTMRMKACVSADPENGVGVQSVTVTLLVEGSASSTAVTISEGDSDLCAETDVSSTYSAGNTLVYSQTAANTPAAAQLNVWLWTVDDVHNQTIYLGSSGGTQLNATAARYMSIVNTNTLNATENNLQVPMPFAGTIQGSACDLTTAPDNGAGTDQYTVAVYINGVASSNTFILSELETDDFDYTNKPPFNAGDTVTLGFIPANTPAVSTVHCGIVVSNTVGGFALLNVETTNASATVTEYKRLVGSPGWVTTENSRFQYSSNMQIRAFYADWSGDPDLGAGTQSYALTMWDDGSPMNCACTTSSGSVACNGTCTDAVAIDSRMAVEKVPANTPTARTVGWGAWAVISRRIISISKEEAHDIYKQHLCKVKDQTTDSICWECDCMDGIDRDIFLHWDITWEQSKAERFRAYSLAMPETTRRRITV